MSEGDTRLGLRILLIDDDPDQRLAVTALLARRGLRDVVEAPDAEHGLRLASELGPDLILLDLAMPGRSGVDVLPDLRVAAPGAAIVVLSNMPRRRLLEQVLQRGAVGFVEKSVPPNRLVDEVLIAAALTDLGHTHVLDLDASTRSAADGRRFARSLLADADRQLVADVELLVSELITNAVIHTRSEPRLAIQVLRDRVRLEIYDADPTPPVARVAGVEQPGGRGLQFVTALSSRWGTEQVESGKVVWVEIDHASA